MIKDLLKINLEEESKRIVGFIKKTLINQGFNRVVIGVSGGLDSITVLCLLRKALGPEKIIAVYFPHVNSPELDKELLVKIKIPINEIVKEFIKKINIKGEDINSKIRAGNVIARIRMIFLFDLAKKYRALVCGTENRSEKLLGYYTRFGDQASDFEPISHLYKSQVKQLAMYLGVPRKIINRTPTAGLWLGQTDEGELGFSYEEVDKVLCLYCDKKMTVEQITKLGFAKAKKIITRYKQNRFKELVPYHL